MYNGTNDEVYYTEFGSVETDDALGTLSAAVVGSNVELLFTPARSPLLHASGHWAINIQNPNNFLCAIATTHHLISGN